MQHAARTKHLAVRNLARLFQAMLTFCPLPIRLQGKHLPGKENIIADLLSRFLLAPSWASVISQTSPTLDHSTPCRVPRELPSVLARSLRSEGNVAMSEPEMMQLWTLELQFLPAGWSTSPSMTSLSSRSHRGKRSHSQERLSTRWITKVSRVRSGPTSALTLSAATCEQPKIGWRRRSLLLSTCPPMTGHRSSTLFCPTLLLLARRGRSQKKSGNHSRPRCSNTCTRNSAPWHQGTRPSSSIFERRFMTGHA